MSAAWFHVLTQPQPVKLGFYILKLYHVLFDEAATMVVHFNTSLHHRLKKKKLSKLLNYVSDSWKHTWEKLASLSRPQQLLLPAEIVHNSRGGAPRFTNEYSAI